MEKEAIREELNKVREEIKSLKNDFFSKKDEKEKFFTEGEDYSNQINSLYDEIKQIEQENSLDKINEDLEAKKKDLDELSGKVKEAEEEFEKVKKNSSTSRDFKPVVKTMSSEKAMKEIKKLDTKLQTQVLSLEKESEITKKIAELKEMVEQSRGSATKTPTSDEFKKAKRNLNSIRRKYNNIEKKIRSLYKQIRLISKEKKKRYKEIDFLRDKKKKAFEEFRLNKKNYSGIGKDLKSLFKKEEDLLTQLGENPDQKKKKSDKEIKQKRKELEDKFMKKGGTLTTEDLLLFQTKK